MAIRIGFVAPCLLEAGAERHMLIVVDGLADAGVDVTWQGCCAVHISSSEADPGIAAEIAVVMPVTYGPTALATLAASCDLLISWAIYDHGQVPGCPPVLWVVHRGEAWGAFTTALLASVTKFVAVSASAAASVPSAYAARTQTILNAVSPARVAITTSKSAKQTSWGFGTGKRMVGLLCRMADEKDPLASGRAARSLRTPYAVVVVGGGPQLLAVQSDASEVTPPQAPILVVGPDTNPGDCLNAFDVLLCPDLANTFGLTIAEGWFLGVPVVSTPSGIAADYPAYVRSIPFGATGSQIKDAIAADFADTSGTAARVAAAQTHAQSAYTLSRFGSEWAAAVHAASGL